MAKCWFHKWKQIHREEVGSSHFIHRKCLKCGIDEVKDYNPFFSSIDEAIKLGTAIGLYKAFKIDRVYEKALDKELMKRGLTLKKQEASEL